MDTGEHVIVTNNSLNDTSRIFILKTVDMVDANSDGIIDPADPNEYIESAGYIVAEQDAASGWTTGSFTVNDDLLTLMDSVNDDNMHVVWKGTHCFYVDGSYIKKWDITTPIASATDFLPATDLVSNNRFYIIGEYIYYTIYNGSATNIETWKAHVDDATTAELVNASNMEIQNIVELTD
jgi:hypothetical protein